MALRQIIETEGKALIQTPFGSIENGIHRISFFAYVKVISITGDKNQIAANVNFKGDTQQFNRQYLIPVSVENGSTNFIAQAYAHLKTLPEFSNATDC